MFRIIPGTDIVCSPLPLNMQCRLEETLKGKSWSRLLSGVHAREVKYHTQGGKCVTCRGLYMVDNVYTTVMTLIKNSVKVKIFSGS